MAGGKTYRVNHWNLREHHGLRLLDGRDEFLALVERVLHGYGVHAGYRHARSLLMLDFENLGRVVGAHNISKIIIF